jgi:S1-C subfamily serine protease
MTPVNIPYQAVVKITVKIRVFGTSVTGWTGSGTIISPDGLILTNAHLVTGERGVRVQGLIISMTESQDQPPSSAYIADVLTVDEDLDIALLQVQTDANSRTVDKDSLDLPHVILGDSDHLELGDPLIILGYPGIGGKTITLTSGVVGGFTGDKEYGDRSFIKTAANITGGTSGGMAMDQYGRMVGIPTQLGYGGNEDFIDCQVMADTNKDGSVDDGDYCLPAGGYINALRPINLTLPIIERFMDIQQ